MQRHWFRVVSDGTYFRNCPLVLEEMKAPRNRFPWRQRALQEEWNLIWKEGVRRVTAIGPHDTWQDYDDSPEATDAWITALMRSHGYPDYRQGQP